MTLTSQGGSPCILDAHDPGDDVMDSRMDGDIVDLDDEDDWCCANFWGNLHDVVNIYAEVSGDLHPDNNEMLFDIACDDGGDCDLWSGIRNSNVKNPPPHVNSPCRSGSEGALAPDGAVCSESAINAGPLIIDARYESAPNGTADGNSFNDNGGDDIFHDPLDFGDLESRSNA